MPSSTAIGGRTAPAEGWRRRRRVRRSGWLTRRARRSPTWTAFGDRRPPSSRPLHEGGAARRRACYRRRGRRLRRRRPPRGRRAARRTLRTRSYVAEGVGPQTSRVQAAPVLLRLTWSRSGAAHVCGCAAAGRPTPRWAAPDDALGRTACCVMRVHSECDAAAWTNGAHGSGGGSINAACCSAVDSVVGGCGCQVIAGPRAGRCAASLVGSRVGMPCTPATDRQ